jgi:hypothetical protein
MYTGVSLLIGLSLLGNIGLVLGLFGYFNRNVILFAIGLMTLISFKPFFTTIRSSLPEIKKAAKSVIKNYWALGMLIASLAIMGTLFLSSMRPPYTIDEIAYHFPQANEIVQNQKINFTFLGGEFYGNIPKLMEVIFAIGIALNGYSLAHSVNFMFLIGFAVFIYGVVKEHFGESAAAGSVLLMSLYDDFTWHATTGYIDAATSILEISAVMFCIKLLTEKGRFIPAFLFIPGILIGSALGMKYSPLPTTLFITIMVGIFLFFKFKRNAKNSILKFGYLLVPALIFGGYWYIKNLILFGNPFFPLYFGHGGMTEIEYESLINAIQQFKPKTISTYFSLINENKKINGFTVYLSFYLFLLALFVKRNRNFILLLLAYSLFYTFYWFLFATHQIRFLTSAILVNSILMSIFIFSRSEKVINKVNLAIFCIAAIFLATQQIPLKTIAHNYLYTKLHVEERQYALGN